jgi:hypothetical protein
LLSLTMIIGGLILLWIAKDRTSLLNAGALIGVKGTHIAGGCVSTLSSSIVILWTGLSQGIRLVARTTVFKIMGR